MHDEVWFKEKIDSGGGVECGMWNGSGQYKQVRRDDHQRMQR